MSRWGIGPRIAVAGGVSLLISGALTYLYPQVFLIVMFSRPLVLTLAIVLLALGSSVLVAAARTHTKVFTAGKLATQGIFAYVRHPIYAAWILLLLPGLALTFRSWLMFLAPIIAYICFKILIKAEDRSLHREFGTTYSEYRARVPELFPIPWRRSSSQKETGDFSR